TSTSTKQHKVKVLVCKIDSNTIVVSWKTLTDISHIVRIPYTVTIDVFVNCSTIVIKFFKLVTVEIPQWFAYSTTSIDVTTLKTSSTKVVNCRIKISKFVLKS